jgi:hypothetical protein
MALSQQKLRQKVDTVTNISVMLVRVMCVLEINQAYNEALCTAQCTEYRINCNKGIVSSHV